METKIDNICNELRDFSQALKQEATGRIKNILPTTDTGINTDANVIGHPYVSNPERPWIVAGSAALAVGVFGAIFSNSTWPYVVGSGGVASILYGQTKKRRHEITNLSQPKQSAFEPKSYEVIEKVIEISKIVEAKWRNRVEDCKVMVQQAIKASTATPEVKDSLMSHTFTTERISIDFDSVVSRIESQPASSYPSILSDFERMLNNCVDRTTTEQLAIYKNISHNI